MPAFRDTGSQFNCYCVSSFFLKKKRTCLYIPVACRFKDFVHPALARQMFWGNFLEKENTHGMLSKWLAQQQTANQQRISRAKRQIVFRRRDALTPVSLPPSVLPPPGELLYHGCTNQPPVHQARGRHQVDRPLR
jgi:hypothetical protein